MEQKQENKCLLTCAWSDLYSKQKGPCILNKRCHEPKFSVTVCLLPRARAFIQNCCFSMQLTFFIFLFSFFHNM